MDQQVAALVSHRLRITQAPGANRHLALACGELMMMMMIMRTHHLDLMYGEIGAPEIGESQVTGETLETFIILAVNVHLTETVDGLINTAITTLVVKTVIVELRRTGSVVLDRDRTDGIDMSRSRVRVRVLGAPINQVDGMLSMNTDIVEIAGTVRRGMMPHHHGEGTVSGKIGINRPQVE